MPVDDDILTPVEAAKLLRVHRNTIYQQIYAGNLPHLRVGRQYRVLKSVVLGRMGAGKTARGGTG